MSQKNDVRIGTLIGAIQTDTKDSTQIVNINSNNGIDDILGKMIELINGSELGEYDKNEAVHQVKQLQTLSQSEQKSGVLEKVKGRLESLAAITKSVTDLTTKLGPILPAVEQWFHTNFPHFPV